MLRGVLELWLPAACAGCRARPWNGRPLCRRCDAALTRAPGGLAPPRGVATLAAAVRFEGAAQDWVHRFKYPPRGIASVEPGPRAVVCAWIREAASGLPGGAPDAIAAVPLHGRRLVARGFDPAGILARELAAGGSGAPHRQLLERVRDTPSQTGLDRRARRRNVRGAFRGVGEAPAHVWLVDDVVTTGSTLGEAARTLRRAGTQRVDAVCAAWTPP